MITIAIHFPFVLQYIMILIQGHHMLQSDCYCQFLKTRYLMMYVDKK